MHAHAHSYTNTHTHTPSQEDMAAVGTVNQDAEGAAKSIRSENKRLSDHISAAQVRAISRMCT